MQTQTLKASNQNSIITKYCYLFEKEDNTTEHITAIFGGMDDLHNNVENAQKELNWNKEDDER